MIQNRTELFENTPVGKAILSLVVPTVISQLIAIAYNMADTFYIGQTGDPNQVAAANLCMPLFIFLTGIANLFGIGGSSMISRLLGEGKREKARSVSSFCVWCSIGLALLYGIVLWFVSPVVLSAFGADDFTYGFCRQYLFWTVTLGAIPTVMNAMLAHLIRAEGYSEAASFGMILGAVLNMMLDPLFIFVFQMEILGAAIATFLSNLVAFGYFAFRVLFHRNQSVLTLSPKYFTVRNHIATEVILVGLPSALMNLMATASNVILNRLLATCCNEAIAGVGIAKKIDIITFGISTGMSQGVIPLIGYNYSSGNYERMKKTIQTAFFMIVGVAVICSVGLIAFAQPLVQAFIDDAITVAYGQKFQRIICLTGPCIAVTLMTTSIFQAVGTKTRPMILSLLRKGVLDIPLMLLIAHFFGAEEIVWATTAADVLALLFALGMFLPFWKRLSKRFY